jgi:hypothetical protein
MGFLGQEDSVEVSSAGRALMSLSEAVKAFVCLVPVALVATWTSLLGRSLVPLLATMGAGTLIAAVACAWFAHPATLNAAFDHQRLVFSLETLGLVKRLRCFWLSLAVAGLDYFALLVFSGATLATHNFQEFSAISSVQFGGALASVALAFLLLRSRLGELRLNALVMGLAALPFYYLLKGAVILYAPRARYAAILGVCFALDLVFAARAGVTGLAGFVTLPCREVVAVWQGCSIALGTACIVVVTVIFNFTTIGSRNSPNRGAMMGLLAGAEAARLALVAVMWAAYDRENLAAP